MGSARDRLLEAAEHCFEAEGIAATGINDLIGEADVARMSLYNHFSSKDDLIVAYLERRDEDWIARLRARLAEIDGHRERLLTVIRAYRWRVAHEGFRGCVFINAAAELPSHHPGWEVIHRHKNAVRALMRSLAQDAGVQGPAALADELFLVAEGAIATAGIQRSDEAFTVAEQTASRIIDAYLKTA